MAIKTSIFGGVTLTGGAAKAFRAQFLESDTKADPRVQKILDQGRRMLKEYNEKGYMTVTARKTPKKG